MIEALEVAGFIWETLSGDPQFSGAVGGRIFRRQVPQPATYPSATITIVSATDINTLSGIRVGQAVLVDVGLHATGNSTSVIGPAAARADALLQGRDGIKNGVVIVKLAREQPTEMVDNEAGVTYLSLIQTYSTKAHAAP